jgi:hypothetical protein
MQVMLRVQVCLERFMHVAGVLTERYGTSGVWNRLAGVGKTGQASPIAVDAFRGQACERHVSGLLAQMKLITRLKMELNPPSGSPMLPCFQCRPVVPPLRCGQQQGPCRDQEVLLLP